MKEGIERIKTKESEPKQIIVELGPGDRPLVWRLKLSRDGEAHYKTDKETLFSVKPGDTFLAVDLPPERSVDVFRHLKKEMAWDTKEKRVKSHLNEIKKYLDEFLPEGVKGEVMHADGQKLPFRDGQIDVLFMANVIGGHAKDDQMLGFRAKEKHILLEKQNLIKEAKRVLKTGGKLIIEEEYHPAESVWGAWKKVMKDLETDSDFKFRIAESYEKEGRLIVELINREGSDV